MKLFLLFSCILFGWLGASPGGAVETPNQLPRQPEPGWGVWRPSSEIEQAQFSAGFSNIELGGSLDFKAFCAQAFGMPVDAEPPFWFRLNQRVEQIGTGVVEFGCWKNGKFTHTFTSTAVNTRLSTVNCLQVVVPEGLNLRSQPGLTGTIIRVLEAGTRVTPDSYPVSMTQQDGRDWLALRGPQEGWVSNDRPDRPSNLQVCQGLPESMMPN